MEHAGVGVGHMGGDHGQLQPGHEPLRRRPAALDAERDDAAGAVGHVFLGTLIVLVPGQTGKFHPGHFFVALEEFGHLLGVLAVPGHPDVEGLQPQIEQVGVHGGGDGAEVPHELGGGLGDIGPLQAELFGVSDAVIALIRGGQAGELVRMGHPVKLAGIHNCTAYCCTVAIHVLCRRMSNNISSPLNWAAVNRCRECIIYNQRYPVCMCCSRKFFNVQNRKCRIGNRLAKYRSCVIFECRIQFLFCTVRRNKCNINSHLFHCHFN